MGKLIKTVCWNSYLDSITGEIFYIYVWLGLGLLWFCVLAWLCWVCPGLAWLTLSGLAWLGLAWLAWVGLAWLGLAWLGLGVGLKSESWGLRADN